MRFVLRSVLALMALVALPVSASLADDDVKTLGTYKAWSAFSYSQSVEGKVCFMASKPTKSLPAGARRGDIYAQVTHRTVKKAHNVFSVIIGYTFKPNSEATLIIGDEKFPLMTQGDSAWAQSDEADEKIAQAIARGREMVIEGLSSRGTKTTDTFSLSGSAAALKAISQECGVK